MDKNYIRLIQGFEQASAMMGPFANFIGIYFKNLLENGFTRQEALSLVESYQIMLFNKAYDIDEIAENIDYDEKEDMDGLENF